MSLTNTSHALLLLLIFRVKVVGSFRCRAACAIALHPTQIKQEKERSREMSGERRWTPPMPRRRDSGGETGGLVRQ